MTLLCLSPIHCKASCWANTNTTQKNIMGNSSTESTSTLRLQRCTKKVPFENILSGKTPVMLALFWGCCAAFINGATLPKVGAKEELFEYHHTVIPSITVESEFGQHVFFTQILIQVQARLSNLWWIPNSVSEVFDTCYENGLIKTVQTIPKNLHVSFKFITLYCGRLKGRWLDSSLYIGGGAEVPGSIFSRFRSQFWDCLV